MKKFRGFVITLLLFGIYGCVSIKPPTFLQADYENKSVKTIGILELKGKSILSDEFTISEMDFKKIENIVIDEVLARKYDVALPAKFKGFGIESEEKLTNKMIGILCEVGKVDAILFSSISEYSDNFLGEHKLLMNFNLFKANGDRIWEDKIDLDRNGLSTFVGFVAAMTLAMVLQPGSMLSTSTQVTFGIGFGALGGLLAEGITPYISGAISERFSTLPLGVGSGKRIR